MRNRSWVLASLFAMSAGTHALAQNAAPKLDVAVRVASLNVSGDTIEIGYVVQNRAGSPLELWVFGLSTPAVVVRMSAPDDRHAWDTQRVHGAEPMPMWAAMGDNVAAGESSPTLTLRAIGVTDLVEFLAVPDLTQIRDTIDDDQPHDQFREHGTTGTVVSVVPPPVNQSPAQQMARLSAFLTRSCGADNWIDNRGICNSLSVKLANASDAIAAGDMEAARRRLDTFVKELDAQRGQHVTEIAYALLRPNAAYLMR